MQDFMLPSDLGLEIVVGQMLEEDEAEANATDDYGHTVLSLATRRGLVEVVRVPCEEELHDLCS